MRARLAAAVLALAGTPAAAHRLDEYLQGTLISVEKNRIEAQMVMTPGVAVFPFVMASIDSDGDGKISEAERSAYAGRVLRDLWLTSNGTHLTPRLVSVKFPAIDEMKEGRGEIRLNFSADLPGGAGRGREIVLENRHLNRISAYQVNSLVPRDPDIRILGQTRNYSQSFYRLDYWESGTGAPGRMIWLGPVAIVLFSRLMFLRRRA